MTREQRDSGLGLRETAPVYTLFSPTKQAQREDAIIFSENANVASES